MHHDRNAKQLFVSTLINFVDRNKNKGMRSTVFQAEKIGKHLGSDVGNALIESIYDSINRTGLKRRLEDIYDKNRAQYERDGRFIDKTELLASQELPTEPDKDGKLETPKNYLPHNSSVLAPDNPQPGNIYHMDGPIGRLKGEDTKGHTAIEIMPAPDGTRMVISSNGSEGVYTQPLDDELAGRTFDVTKPPRSVDNDGIAQGTQALAGHPYDYGQFVKQNDLNRYTCTEVSCEISRQGGNEINLNRTGKTLEPNEVYHEALRQGHTVIHWQDTPYSPQHEKNQ